jgi:tRNA 2-thiocytidine biosynthesis protein TtcA
MEFKGATGRKLEKVLLNRVGRAIADFSLLREGDRVAVALSGGKDSWSLTLLLEELRRRAPVRFDLVALTAHNGSESFQSGLIEDFLHKKGIQFHLEMTEISRLVPEKLRPGTPACSLCARLRRGALYRAAAKLRCNKLALGHHLDDAIETLLMNLFFEGALKAMPPKFLAENGAVTVIRPLIYVPEAMLAQYASEQGAPVVSCGCFLCGMDDSERKKMKELVASVSSRYPRARRAALRALANVQPRFLLDARLHDFGKEEGSPPRRQDAKGA